MDEWERLRARLTSAGVAGADDLGKFTSNPEFFGASEFDERAAMPVLIAALPTLRNPKVVSAVAGHLRRPWARPAAFDAVLEAFETWAQRDGSAAGWHLGDALGTTATKTHVGTLLHVSQDTRYGQARQMVVHALGRFKKAPDVAPALLRLIEDPDVALHAMQALRRVVGGQQALPHLERIERAHHLSIVREQAAREVKKARTSRT